MNQASFGYLLEHVDLYKAKIKSVSTRLYNAVECDWRYVNDETAFIHYKSMLRRKILLRLTPSGEHKEAMIRWYKYADCNSVL